MKTSTLKVGDRIHCHVRGQIFTARFLGASLIRRGAYRIDDPNPTSATYRHVTARQIVGKVSGAEVGA